MLRPLLSLAFATTLALFSGGCVSDPAPQANGFNVELWFEAPSGGLVVGAPKEVTVQRLEARYTQCSGADSVCDVRAAEPIALVSAACDDGACTVTTSTTRDGALVLETVGVVEGPTTLRVKVKDVATGDVLEDAYPLVIQLPHAPYERRALVTTFR